MDVRFEGGARDGARLDITAPHLTRPGARIVLPILAPVDLWPDGIAPDSRVETAEYVVEGWREPVDAAPRYLVARPRG